MTGATAVADADLLGTEIPDGTGIDFASDLEAYKLGYIGALRFTRMTLTSADNTGAWTIAAIAIQGHGLKPPYTTQQT
jgi:hypothetical protein